MKPITEKEKEQVKELTNKFYQNDGHRFGQAYMNALHGIRPDLENIINGTELDMFYDESFGNLKVDIDIALLCLENEDLDKELVKK